jgi:hypothetical protein
MKRMAHIAAARVGAADALVGVDLEGAVFVAKPAVGGPRWEPVKFEHGLVYQAVGLSDGRIAVLTEDSAVYVQRLGYDAKGQIETTWRKVTFHEDEAGAGDADRSAPRGAPAGGQPGEPGQVAAGPGDGASGSEGDPGRDREAHTAPRRGKGVR